MKLFANSLGRKVVNLYRDEKRQQVRVHSLVLESFVGPRPDGCECLHGNGNSSDNRLANLRWGNSKENHADSIRHGAHPHGETHGQAKLTEPDVLEIRRRYTRGDNMQSYAKQIGVAKATVQHAATGRTWKHIN